MEFEEFKTKLLEKINKRDSDCLKLIDKNKNLVQEYFTKERMFYVREFIDDLYEPILNEKKKFKVIEKVLKHPLMKVVLEEFRKSQTLIKICRDGNNKQAMLWLLSMDMDQCVQDKLGRTALMYLVKQYHVDMIIDEFLKVKGDHYNLTDENGNTALFYATHGAPFVMRKLLKSGLFDYNHLNNKHENILMYNTLVSFELLMDKPDIDYNVVNNEGKNLAMILVENGRYNELMKLNVKKGIDVNYQNQYGETLVSIFFKKYHELVSDKSAVFETEKNRFKIQAMSQTLKTLIKLGCDFNRPIDNEGNTPVMYFLIMEDYHSLQYLIDNCS
ncbi:hypothetical protein PIROE2DRAFT_62710 [Piromyces sp. E2]|nr:hypothetical protein PIROE2DRAFT_62710 [Piromyces sp. E2]|eukprot:OUM61121.1 hypothetical protein PIROE2DRAFT_62710 [Piromyces sp. E2]